MITNWVIDINTKKMPDNVKTAFDDFSEKTLGSDYTFISYLGSRTNEKEEFAVLAKQKITDKETNENIVLLVFKEDENEENNISPLAIVEQVIDGDSPVSGSIEIIGSSDIPKEASDLYTKESIGDLANRITPFAILAKKVLRGCDYIFAARLKNDSTSDDHVVVFTINDQSKSIRLSDILRNDDYDVEIKKGIV